MVTARTNARTRPRGDVLSTTTISVWVPAWVQLHPQLLSTDSPPLPRYLTQGGYYGACTEKLMMAELFLNGPIVVGFEVYEDLVSYKSGL